MIKNLFSKALILYRQSEDILKCELDCMGSFLKEADEVAEKSAYTTTFTQKKVSNWKLLVSTFISVTKINWFSLVVFPLSSRDDLLLTAPPMIVKELEASSSDGFEDNLRKDSYSTNQFPGDAVEDELLTSEILHDTNLLIQLIQLLEGLTDEVISVPKNTSLSGDKKRLTIKPTQEKPIDKSNLEKYRSLVRKLIALLKKVKLMVQASLRKLHELAYKILELLLKLSLPQQIFILFFAVLIALIIHFVLLIKEVDEILEGLQDVAEALDIKVDDLLRPKN